MIRRCPQFTAGLKISSSQLLPSFFPMRIFVLLAVCFPVLNLCAIEQEKPVRLWEGDAPGALGKVDQDIPTLTAYLPLAEKNTGTAIIVCPGGGYGSHASYEGADYADYLAKNGIAGFVLKYRLGTHGYRHPLMLQDAQRAIRMLRAHAEQWKIKPNQIGIMGSSAGGHLASHAACVFDAGKADAADTIDRVSSRPDFAVMCYPVISTDPAVSSKGSMDLLVGKDADAKLLESVSTERLVIKETPPCFLFHTYADTLSVEHSLRFVNALQKAGVPYDLHVFQKGEHGVALSPGKNGVAPDDVHPWAKDLLFWLKQNGWM